MSWDLGIKKAKPPSASEVQPGLRKSRLTKQWPSCPCLTSFDSAKPCSRQVFRSHLQGAIDCRVLYCIHNKCLWNSLWSPVQQFNQKENEVIWHDFILVLAQMVERLPGMWETWVWFLGREDLLEKEMATHSSTLAWKIPWMEKPGRLQSMESQRVGHDWATSLAVILVNSYLFHCYMHNWKFTILAMFKCTVEALSGLTMLYSHQHYNLQSLFIFSSSETLHPLNTNPDKKE